MQDPLASLMNPSSHTQLYDPSVLMQAPRPQSAVEHSLMSGGWRLCIRVEDESPSMNIGCEKSIFYFDIQEGVL